VQFSDKIEEEVVFILHSIICAKDLTPIKDRCVETRQGDKRKRHLIICLQLFAKHKSYEIIFPLVMKNMQITYISMSFVSINMKNIRLV
jgi:hypothetical protein